MPKALRLFLHDDIKLTVSTTVPTEISHKVNRIQGQNVNLIDLSKREDIESVELNLVMKEGAKPYEAKPMRLPDNAKIVEKKQGHFLSRFFKRGNS